MFRNRAGAVLLALALALPLVAAPAKADSDFRYFPETGHYVRGDYLVYFDSHGGIDVLGNPRTEDFREADRTGQYFQNVRLEWDCGETGRDPCVLQPGLLGEQIFGRALKLPPERRSQGFRGSDAWSFPESGNTIVEPFLSAYTLYGGVAFLGYPISDAAYLGTQQVQWFQRGRLQLDADGIVRLSPLGDYYIDTLKRVSPVYLVRKVAPAPPAAVSVAARMPQGHLVYQSSFGGQIVLSDADGTSSKVVATGSEPSLSPDGSTLAYVRWGEPPGLYIMNLATGEESRAFSQSFARAPIWSPDGTRIAFLRTKQDPVLKLNPVTRRPGYTLEDHWSVAVLDVGSGSVLDLPSMTFSTYPSWSPDGKRIVFDGNDGLFIVNANADGTINRIPGTNVTFTQPSWSPDGSLIAFSLERADHWDIAVMSPDGGGIRVVTEAPIYTRASNNVSPSWSPDGTQIAFLSDRDGFWQLYTTDADGKNVRPVYTGDASFEYDFSDERVVHWSR